MPAGVTGTLGFAMGRQELARLSQHEPTAARTKSGNRTGGLQARRRIRCSVPVFLHACRYQCVYAMKSQLAHLRGLAHCKKLSLYFLSSEPSSPPAAFARAEISSRETLFAVRRKYQETRSSIRALRWTQLLRQQSADLKVQILPS
jgi:hypothetical protein